MGKALLGLKVANQFATPAFGELSVGQRYVGGFEVRSDVCGGGFFAHCKDLRVCRRQGYGQEACDEGRSVTGQCHGSTSDVQQFAPSPLLLTRGNPTLRWTKALTFFAVVESRFYRGFLRKDAFLVWCFCGEVVVVWW